MKTAIAAALLVVLALSGCSGATEAADAARVAAGSTAEELAAPDNATSVPTEAEVASLTRAGSACDPHNLNDMICLAFHPDIAVMNMTSGTRAQEPLRSMTNEQKVALAHAACNAFDAGDTAATVSLVATELDADAQAAQIPADINNTNVFLFGALAYCNDHFNEDDGVDSLWTISAYRDMGENAALQSFADGRVIQRP